jgi:hypothetical protein
MEKPAVAVLTALSQTLPVWEVSICAVLLTKEHRRYPIGDTVKQTRGAGVNDKVEESLDDDAAEAEDETPRNKDGGASGT